MQKPDSNIASKNIDQAKEALRRSLIPMNKRAGSDYAASFSKPRGEVIEEAPSEEALIESVSQQTEQVQPQFVNFQQEQQAEQAQMQPSQLQTGIDQQKQGILEQAAIEGEAGSEMAKVYGQAEQQMQKKQADFEIKQQDRMKEVENLTKKFENQQQAIKEMSLKGVDWWGSKTTGEKITAGIGLFLSALSNQSMKNTLDIIDREVDRDLKIQQANIEKAKGDLSQTQNLLGLNRDLMKDDQLALQTARIDAFELAKLKIEQVTSRAKSPLAKAKAAELMGKLDEKIGLLQAKAVQDAMKSQGQPIKTQKFTGQIPDKQMAKDFMEEAVDVQTISESLDRLNKFANSSSSKVSPEDRARIETDINLLVGALNRPLTGGGPMAEAEAERIRNTIGDPSKFLTLPSSTKAKIGALKDFINRKHEIRASNLGLKPISGDFASFKEGKKAK
jgi:hypothetical protein